MSVRGSRLSRLLRLISLLRGPSAWTGKTLAEHFGTSRRNVQRDIAVLRLAGVPVVRDEEFGPNGSYRITKGWYFPHIPLSDQECLELSVLARTVEGHGLQLLDSVLSVRDKILDTLPPKQQDIVRDASALFDVLSTGTVNQAHCSKIMTSIQKALLTGCQIEGKYHAPHHKKTKQVCLQPRRVFLAGHSCWYLAACDNEDGMTKLFRLARFREVTVLKKPVTVKAEWSLKEMLGNAWTVFRGDREFHIEIEFDAEAGELVEEIRWHATQEIERLKDGRVLFRATVSGLEEVKFWVLGFGPRAKVLKPKQLVEEIRRLAREIELKYSPSTGRGNKGAADETT
jgi:predicted DNA-binding transcriptional regulator YafY